MHLTVVLPTYNRSAVLDRTLQIFAKMSMDDVPWELLVVNNASTDDTEHVIERHARSLPIVGLREHRPGKNHANNRAIECARGEILVFCDDDISPEPDWLLNILDASARWPNHSVFGGRVVPDFPLDAFQFIRSADYSNYVFAIHDLPQQEGEYPSGCSPVGPNCWVRAQIFRSGFRYDGSIGPKGRGRVSGSELEFFQRLMAYEYRPVYVPSAMVRHRIQRNQVTLRYLLKRSFASGRGHARIFGYPSDTPRIFGIPRYLYREFAEHAARGAGLLAFGSTAQAFEYAMRCSVVAGAMLESAMLESAMLESAMLESRSRPAPSEANL